MFCFLGGFSVYCKENECLFPGCGWKGGGGSAMPLAGDTPVPPKMVGSLNDTSLTAEHELQLNVSTETSLLENFNVLIAVF